MKKLTLALALIGLSSSLGAYAAFPTGAQPFQIVVPNLDAGFEFTLEGNYLQPSNSDLDYATVALGNLLEPSLTTGGGTQIFTANPNYAYGFRIGLGYVFPNSGNDVQASWAHFDNSSSTIAVLGGPVSVTTRSSWLFPVFGPEAGGSDALTSTDTTFKNDAIDLDVGQYLSIGTRLQARLFAGLRLAQVTSDIDDSYSDSLNVGTPELPELETFDLEEHYRSQFTGLGPRFGVNANFHIAKCFGVVAQLAGSLLVGRVESSYFSEDAEIFTGVQPVTFTGSSSLNTPNQTRVVPTFDSKLGINYSVAFNNTHAELTVELGYQITEYLDAIDRVSPIWANDGLDSLPATMLGFTRTTSNLSFAGPYLSLNVKL